MEHSEELAEMQNDIKTIKDAVLGLVSKMSSLEARLDKVENRLDIERSEVKNEISQMEERFTRIANAVDMRYGAKMETLEATMGTILRDRVNRR